MTMVTAIAKDTGNRMTKDGGLTASMAEDKERVIDEKMSG